MDSSREFNVRFIDVLRLHPCLWNVNSGEYYNAERKAEAIARLIEVSLPYCKEANADFVSKKVLHLKTVVRREFRKVEESKVKTGEATYAPSLWYYDRASFLVEKAPPLRRQSSEDELEGSLPDLRGLRKFSHEEVVRFVQLYRRQECLWNQRMDAYRSPQSRDRAYREIRRRFGGSPLLSLDEVKAKIKGIRATYNKELAKVLRDREKGAREPYVPKLVWYQLADSFLRPRGDTENQPGMDYGGDGTPQGSSASVHLMAGASSSRQILPSPQTESGLPRRFCYDETIKFLDLYQQQQCLWNPLANDYKDPRARRRAHMTIAQKFGGRPPLSYLEVKNKIKGIRTIYSRELSKLMRCSGGRAYKPTLAWFQRADSFLRDVRLSKVQIWTMESVSNSDQVTEYSQDSSTVIALDASPSHSPQVLEISSPSAAHYTELQPYPQLSALELPNECKIEHLEMPVKETPQCLEQAVEVNQPDNTMATHHLLGQPSNFKTPDTGQQLTDQSSLQPCFPVKLMASKMPCSLDAPRNTNEVWTYNEETNHPDDNEQPETPVQEVDLDSDRGATDESDHEPKGSREDPRRRPRGSKRWRRQRKRKETKEDCYSSIVNLLKHKLKSCPSSGDGDRFDLAARSWASTLRELGCEQQIYAERLISEVLCEARLGNLNRNVRLQFPEPQASELRELHSVGGPRNVHHAINNHPNHKTHH